MTALWHVDECPLKVWFCVIEMRIMHDTCGWNILNCVHNYMRRTHTATIMTVHNTHYLCHVSWQSSLKGGMMTGMLDQSAACCILREGWDKEYSRTTQTNLCHLTCCAIALPYSPNCRLWQWESQLISCIMKVLSFSSLFINIQDQVFTYLLNSTWVDISTYK